MTKKYYITTPLYYVNDVPHIGHAYTTIAADVLARWKRLRGESVFFLTGTDEHGSKIAQAAEKAGLSPQAFADGIVAEFQRLWKRLGITYDDFIRTTEPRHKTVAQAVFEDLLKKGDIYKGFYEDWYCVPDETFWSESELVGGKCPTCGRVVEKIQEESYFFKLESYKDRLLALFKKDPKFLQPSYRANEIINFVKELKNLSVSRTKVKWGIPVLSDPGHTIYVWFEALLNYISAAGYHPDPAKQNLKFKEIWPADVHLVGKEIFRFHTAIWPAMLMALGFSDDQLPRRVFAHGWWTVEGDKMSKSKGNVVDPHQVADEYSVDALRYFVLREIPFGGDGDFSKKGMLGRYNAELANALGNLLNRTLNLIEKNCEGKIPTPTGGRAILDDAAVPEWIKKFDASLENLAFHEALEQIIGLVNACNKYLDEQAPWKTAKTDLPAAQKALYEVIRILKMVTVGLHPFMPSITVEMWKQMGESKPLSEEAPRILLEGVLNFAEGQAVQKGAPLFPRKEPPAAPK
jgi:methionyl-tRNA synthetase